MNCKNCGAPPSIIKSTCEYCGTPRPGLVIIPRAIRQRTQRVVTERAAAHRLSVVLALIVTAALLTQASMCSPGNIRKFKQGLDKAAVTLNAAAKTNRSFYESGVYGPAGSPEAIETRQKVAKGIHDANEWLIKAIEKAKLLKADSVSFEGDKLEILLSLSKAAANLKTGRVEIDLVLQSVALIINQSVGIIQALKSADVKYLVPAIKDWQIARVEV